MLIDGPWNDPPTGCQCAECHGHIGYTYYLYNDDPQNHDTGCVIVCHHCATTIVETSSLA